jgi:hypothetical protein
VAESTPKRPREPLLTPCRSPTASTYLKNVRDVVSRVFRHHEEILDLVPTPAHHFQRPTNLRLDREASKERTREKTRELFESIHALSKKGMKNAQVARELGIHRHTVEKYLAFKSPPKHATSPGR